MREFQSSEAMAASHVFSRSRSYSTAATSTADSDYPPPTPPQEFSGSDVAEESFEGADLNIADDAEAMNDPSMYNVDGNYGDAEEEDCIWFGFLCKYERGFHFKYVLEGLFAEFR